MHMEQEKERVTTCFAFGFLKSPRSAVFKEQTLGAAASCPRRFTIAIDDRTVPSTRSTLPCRATTSSFADWGHAVSARVRSDACDELRWNGTEGRFCEFDAAAGDDNGLVN